MTGIVYQSFDKALQYADSAAIATKLTSKSKRALRLIHIFGAVADVIKQDLRANKFKYICFSTFPTTTMIASGVWIAAGLTKNARNYRRHIAESFSNAVNYKFYRDFMNAGFNGDYDIDVKKYCRHVSAQKYYMTLHNLQTMAARYQSGALGCWFHKRLHKHTSKGELTLVS